MAVPGAVVVSGSVRPCVEHHCPAPVRVRSRHLDLEFDRLVGGQRKRCRQRQFLQYGGTRPDPGVDRHVDEGRRRQEHRVQHRVVGEPGLVTQGQPAAQQQAVVVRRRRRRSQERVGRGVGLRRGCGQVRLQPVPLTLERVGGQRRTACATPGEDRVPVHVHTVGVERGHRGEQRPGLRPWAAQRRDGQRLGAVRTATGRGRRRVSRGRRAAGEAVTCQAREHTVRAQFHEVRGPLLPQVPHRVGETDRPSYMVHPVPGRADLLGGGGPVRHRGDEGELRRGVGDPPRDQAEGVEHGFHVRRVERMAHPQTGGLASLFAPVRDDLQHRGFVPGDDHGATVHGCDVHPPHPVRSACQIRGDLALVGLYRGHRPAGGQRVHQSAPCRDQGAGVREGQHAGDVRRRQFTDRVPGHHVGAYAPGLQQPEQRDLQSEECGLREARRVQDPARSRTLGALGAPHAVFGTLGVLGGKHHVPQWLRQKRVQQRADLVEGTGVDGMGLVQLPAHPGPLTALPGEHEDDRARRAGTARAQARPVAAFRHRVERGEQFVTAPGHHHRAMLEMGAGRGQGETEVQQVRSGAFAHVGMQLPSLCPQPRGAPRRRRERHGRHRGHGHLGDRGSAFRAARGTRLLHGRLLDHHMRVGPADPEGRHTRPPGPPGPGPGHRAGQQRHRTRRPVHAGVRLLGVERTRQYAVRHRLDHFHHGGHTRRRLRMPDVRLDRAQPQWVFPCTGLPVGLQERFRLDDVTSRVPVPCASTASISAGPHRRRPEPGGSRVAAPVRAARSGRCSRRPGSLRNRAPRPGPGSRPAGPPTAVSPAAFPRPRPTRCRPPPPRTPCSGRRGPARAAC